MKMSLYICNMKGSKQLPTTTTKTTTMYHIVISRPLKDSTVTFRFKSEEAGLKFMSEKGLCERIIDKFFWA